MDLVTFLVIFSALSFLVFGITCFVTDHMRAEFVRYGLSKQLYLVGSLQIIGAIGLCAGYFLDLNLLTIISAIGLALLMLLGFGVRLRTRDTFIQSAPSVIYSAINTYIAIAVIYEY